MDLVLYDSIRDCDDGVCKNYYQQSAGFMRAIDELQKQFVNGTIDVISLQNYNQRANAECPVGYHILSYDEKRGYKVVNECNFFASHYIGRYTYGDYNIIVNPRFGNIFTYLIGYAANIYLPLGESHISFNTQNNSSWLIALLWKAMLNKALTTGQIPKDYEAITRNQRNYRGRLALSKHIRANLCDATRFYCTYKKLSMDTVINRTIRATYKVLKDEGASAVVTEFEAYDKYLDSMGVMSFIQNIRDIDNINYTRLTAPYKSVMELSKTILQNFKAEAANHGSDKRDVSYFIDVAELWEMYILKLLQNNLSSEYHVSSPNTYTGAKLLDDKIREIRPDILIEKNGDVVMIIDAKYKNYFQFGAVANNGISREDLYQMSTYLYHYGKEGKRIVGIFTSPVDSKEQMLHTFSENKKHQIGLINLAINEVNSIDTIHQIENEYINKIRQVIKDMYNTK